MKSFTHKLSDPLPDLNDQHIFEEREARRDAWDEKAEHENDLRQESIRDYESDQLAGNPPEQGE